MLATLDLIVSDEVEGGICQSQVNSSWGIFGRLLNFFKKLIIFSVFIWNFN